ncbi:MAG: leucyl/phenylalanyl-tRNA--protein transferase [Gammaproteobacteria bacterium]
MTTGLAWLDPATDQPFPDPEQALDDPPGLLAIGGDLSPKRLRRAYRHGIFPWNSASQPILWWSPDPRTVLFPERIKISRSLRKTLNKRQLTVTMDQAFSAVIHCCGLPRKSDHGTWLTPEMRRAYIRFHDLGYAHSVETWRDRELVGGLYGVALGRVFYGESMFSQVTDASKIALVHLCLQLRRWSFAVIDCQMYTAHLLSLGAEPMPRRDFLALLDQHCDATTEPGRWRLDLDLLNTLTPAHASV